MNCLHSFDASLEVVCCDDAEGRTIFLRDLSPETTSNDVKAALQKHGEVTMCLIVKDKTTNQSKGSAFAQFASADHARLYLAKAVNGTIEINGRRARIDFMLQEYESEWQGHKINHSLILRSIYRMAGRNSKEELMVADNQVFVRGLAYSATEEDLRKAFEEIGPLKNVSIAKEKDGRSRGFGFVKFSLEGDVATALSTMQGHVLLGKPLKLEQGMRKANEPPSKKKRKQAEINEEEPALVAKPAVVAKETKIAPVKAAAAAEQPAKKAKVTPQTTLSIPSPASIHRNRQVVVFGVPIDASKGAFLKALRMQKACSHLKYPLTAEFIEGDNEELAIMHPPGKVLLITAGSKPEAVKVIAALTMPEPTTNTPTAANATATADTSLPKKGLSIEKFGLLRLVEGKEGKNTSSTEDGEADDALADSDPLAQLQTKNMQQAGAALLPRFLSSVTPLTHRNKQCRLIIRNLSYQANETRLLTAMQPYGPLAAIELPAAGEGKKGHRGFAFVTFLCGEDAAKVVAIGGQRPIKVCKREVAIDFCLSKVSYQKEQQAMAVDGEAAEAEADSHKVEAESEDGSDAMDVDGDNDEPKEDDDKDHADSDQEEAEDTDNEDDDEDQVNEPTTNPTTTSSSMLRAGTNSSDVAEGRTIFLRGLSPETTSDDVKAALQKHGEVTMCLIVKDKTTNQSRGSAFAQFASADHARLCLAKAVNGTIEINGRRARIDLALDRDSATKINAGLKPGRDKRNLYLATEGLLPTQGAPTNLNEVDKEKRSKAAAEKKKKLVNPLFYVSAERLSIRNLSKQIRDNDLKIIALKAAKAGLSKGLVTLQDMRNLQLAQGPELFSGTSSSSTANDGQAKGLTAAARKYRQEDLFTLPTFDGKTALVSAKVMLDLPERDDKKVAIKKISTKDIPSKGYGFVEFTHHAYALACLRELNDNPVYETQAVRPGSRLIVECAVENFRKVSVLKERMARQETRRMLSNPAASADVAADRLKRRREKQREKKKQEKAGKAATASKAAAAE